MGWVYYQAAETSSKGEVPRRVEQFLRSMSVKPTLKKDLHIGLQLGRHDGYLLFFMILNTFFSSVSSFVFFLFLSCFPNNDDFSTFSFWPVGVGIYPTPGDLVTVFMVCTHQSLL